MTLQLFGVAPVEVPLVEVPSCDLRGPARYFSYRTMLIATVSLNYLVLVLVGCHKIIARYVAKLGGGGANLPAKVSRDMEYCSDSIAISRNMGPLRL